MEDKNPKDPQEMDYYFENGLMVMTESYLLKQGKCCGNGCRHCPYPEDSSSLES